MVKQQTPQVRSPQLDALGLRIASKDEVADLTPLDISPWTIQAVSQPDEFDRAITQLCEQRVLGYDTEADPSFKKDEPPKPTSVIQLATASHCYLFFPQKLRANQVDIAPLLAILASPEIIKVGAALRFDRQQLRREFSLQTQGLCDLVSIFHRLGVKNQLGVKTILAMLVQRQLQKSKRISRSRWSNWPLTQAQIDYASADAIAPLICFQAFRSLFLDQYTALNPRTQADIKKLLFMVDPA